MEGESYSLKNYEIHLNTRDLVPDAVGQSRYTVVLPEPIQSSTDGDHFVVSLASAEIPISWYAFSAGLSNVQLWMAGVLQYTLPEGNYSATDLATVLTGDSAFPYSVTWSRRTDKLTLTNTDATTHTINCGASDLCYYLGLGTTNLTITAGSTVVATNCLNIATVKSLFIHASFSADNTMMSTTDGIIQAAVIDKVAVNQNPSTLLCWGAYDSATFGIHVHDSQIRGFRFAILDQSSRDIDFNGLSLGLSFLIELRSPSTARPDLQPYPLQQIQAQHPSSLGRRGGPMLDFEQDALDALDARTDAQADGQTDQLEQEQFGERPDDILDLRLRARALMDGARYE